jgi:hypothetical protein
MNCSDVLPLLAELLAGDLAVAQADAVHRHLKDCPSCQDERQALAQVLGALDTAADPEVRVDLRRLYQQAAERQRRLARRWRRLCLVAAAAAVLLVLWLGLGLQVRVEHEQLVVRWSEQTPADRVPERDRQVSPPGPVQPKQSAPIDARTNVTLVSDVKLLRELVHALAAEVERLDGKQEQQLQALREELARLRALSENRWSTAESHFTVLYNSQFGTQKEDKP